MATTFAGIDDAPTWALPRRFSTELAKELKLLFLLHKEIGVVWPAPWVFFMGGWRAEDTLVEEAEIFSKWMGSISKGTIEWSEHVLSK